MWIPTDNAFVTYQMFRYKAYGHSSNVKLRKEAASGGVVTELLKYLLKNDTVDYVVTADTYHYDRNCGYVIIDKSNVDFLDNHSGSNYCPSNIGKALKVINKIEGKYAVVCLPCLARGIYKLKNDNPTLNDRISYIITLLCNHVPSYEATDYIVKKYKISFPKMIKYRGNGWFGSFRAYENSENETEFFSVPFSEYFSSKYSEYFWQEACVNCKDHFGIYSDICMGDADFVKYRETDKENHGETIVFSNNQELFTILGKMCNEGIISLFEDISDHELKLIYDPLSDGDRASKRNTRTGVKDILREEKNAKRKALLKKSVYIPKRLIKKVIKELLNNE